MDGSNRVVAAHDFNNVLMSIDDSVHALAAGWVGFSPEVSELEDGTGIDAAELERVVDPFFTTRADEGNSGLGLWGCRQLWLPVARRGDA